MWSPLWYVVPVFALTPSQSTGGMPWQPEHAEMVETQVPLVVTEAVFELYGLPSDALVDWL